MTAEIKQLMDKVDHLQSDINYLKKHLVNVDSFLTDEDLESLDKADEDLKSNKTKRL
jgi:prefoldin subunit 5